MTVLIIRRKADQTHLRAALSGRIFLGFGRHSRKAAASRMRCCETVDVNMIGSDAPFAKKRARM